MVGVEGGSGLSQVMLEASQAPHKDSGYCLGSFAAIFLHSWCWFFTPLLHDGELIFGESDCVC